MDAILDAAEKVARMGPCVAEAEAGKSFKVRFFCIYWSSGALNLHLSPFYPAHS